MNLESPTLRNVQPCEHFLVCVSTKFQTFVLFPEGYTHKDVEYIWSLGSGSSIKMSPDMRMSMFDLIGYPHDKGNITQVHGERLVFRQSQQTRSSKITL